jgi:hypothetical protein|tara:strand:+ start:18 stop:248 length:231 start_codon:yes stop_codon:yes gene_type:complete
MSGGSIKQAISAYKNTIIKIANKNKVKLPPESRRGLMANSILAKRTEQLDLAKDVVAELVAEIRELRQRTHDGRKT